ALAAELVQRQDLVFRLVQLHREFPALDLEDDPEDLDSLLLAVLDELGVVDESVHAEAGSDLLPRLLLEIGQRDGAAAERRPDERGSPVRLKIFDHLQRAGRQARVVAVLTGEPGVEIDSALHVRSFLSLGRNFGRSQAWFQLSTIPSDCSGCSMTSR